MHRALFLIELEFKNTYIYIYVRKNAYFFYIDNYFDSSTRKS